MNPLTDLDFAAVGAFAAVVLGASAGLVLTAGYFPAAARPEALRHPLAPLAILAGVATTVALAVVAVIGALHLPWAVAVVAGGSAFLAAPFVIQPLPARLRDSALGALLFAAIGLGLLLVLPLPPLPVLL
jgi:hypothetical protein